MSEIKFHEDMNLTKFLSQWFGIIGRELGSNAVHNFGIHPDGRELSHRMFTDDFNVFLKFMEWTEQNKHACWTSSQPMRTYGIPFGLEKIVYDFDYPLKEDEVMIPEKKEEVKVYVQSFLNYLECKPLVLETYKGFHVVAFLRKIYEFKPTNLDFATDVFGSLAISVAGIENKLYHQMTEEDKNRWKFLDWAVAEDIMRMERVPLSTHEKSGLKCTILDEKLEPTKVRSADYYKSYGVTEYEIRRAVEVVSGYYKRKSEEEEERVKNGKDKFTVQFTKKSLRPCFSKRLQTGQMTHQQRLALLSEMYYSGYDTEDKMLEICRSFADFSETKSLEQIRWYLNNSTNVPPYRCETLRKYGWCLRDECEFYNGRNTYK